MMITNLGTTLLGFLLIFNGLMRVVSKDIFSQYFFLMLPTINFIWTFLINLVIALNLIDLKLIKSILNRFCVQ